MDSDEIPMSNHGNNVGGDGDDEDGREKRVKIESDGQQLRTGPEEKIGSQGPPINAVDGDNEVTIGQQIYRNNLVIDDKF